MAETDIAVGVPFAKALSILRVINQISADGAGTFRARVEALQKTIAGLAGDGKGKKRQYADADILHLAVVIDLISVGLSPAAISSVMKASAFTDKAAELQSAIRKAVELDQPIAFTAHTLGHLGRFYSPQLSVGLPENPGRHGPFALVYPAIRAKQIAAAKARLVA